MDERTVTTHSKVAPYLETLSSGSQTNFQRFPLHKKLLVQPVTIPSLQHLGIATKLGGGGPDVADPARYANFDGRVTNTLRNIVRKVPGAIREDYRQATRDARRVHSQMKKEKRRRSGGRNGRDGKNPNRRDRPPSIASIESISMSEADRLESTYFAAAYSEEEEEVGEDGELLDEERSEELLSEDESIRTDGRLR